MTDRNVDTFQEYNLSNVSHIFDYITLMMNARNMGLVRILTSISEDVFTLSEIYLWQLVRSIGEFWTPAYDAISSQSLRKTRKVYILMKYTIFKANCNSFYCELFQLTCIISFVDDP